MSSIEKKTTNIYLLKKTRDFNTASGIFFQNCLKIYLYLKNNNCLLLEIKYIY